MHADFLYNRQKVSQTRQGEKKKEYTIYNVNSDTDQKPQGL